MLDVAILEMHRGLSLRAALPLAASHLPIPVQHLIHDALLSPAARRLNSTSFLSKSMRKNLTEVLKIEQLKSNQLVRIKNLRDQVTIQNDFRHRSGQALLQTRIQALFITILYFLILTATLHHYPWKVVRIFIWASLVLLVLGVGLLYTLTRKRKWKT